MAAQRLNQIRKILGNRNWVSKNEKKKFERNPKWQNLIIKQKNILLLRKENFDEFDKIGSKNKMLQIFEQEAIGETKFWLPA